MPIVARLRDANHPGGFMRRSGLVFGPSFQAYEVTQEQLDALMDEAMQKYIIVKTEGSIFNEITKEIQAGEAVRQDDQDDENKDQEDEEENVEDEEVEQKEELDQSKMTKVQIMEELEKKGLKRDVDFSDKAKNKDLLDLLNTL